MIKNSPTKTNKKRSINKKCQCCKSEYSKVSLECGHKACNSCTQSETECIACGLRIGPFLDEDSTMSYSQDTREDTNTKSYEHTLFDSSERVSDKKYSSEDGEQKQKETNPKIRIEQFICQFHDHPITSKHQIKNKFQCKLCHVTQDYVVPQDVLRLKKDLLCIKDYLDINAIDVHYKIDNLFRLHKIYSKTILVFNNKLRDMRAKLDIFIPFTDNKGPVTRFNLNRWTDDKFKSNLYKGNEVSELKLEQQVNRALNYQEAKNDDSQSKYEQIMNNINQDLTTDQLKGLYQKQKLAKKQFLMDIVVSRAHVINVI